MRARQFCNLTSWKVLVQFGRARAFITSLAALRCDVGAMQTAEHGGVSDNSWVPVLGVIGIIATAVLLLGAIRHLAHELPMVEMVEEEERRVELC